MGKHRSLAALGPCISNLRLISRNLSTQSPSHIADVYLAAIGLLCHLKSDTAVLQASWRNDPQGHGPVPAEIPAITAVIQDPKLFDALVSCLRPAGAGGDLSEAGATAASRLHATAGIPHHHHTASNIPSRKRAGSASSELDMPPIKAIKHSHSPTPTSHRLFGKHQISGTQPSEYSPILNVQIVAATILYLSFAHLDHWPVQLVKAYAEDCFGPRSWVDHASCKLLVDNLRLLHEGEGETSNGRDSRDEEMKDSLLLEEAEKVALAYSQLKKFIAEDDAENDNASPQRTRRGSLSSVGSEAVSVSQSTSISSLVRPNSRDEGELSPSNESSKKKKKLAKQLQKKELSGDDGGSSSSGEEDEQVIVTTKSDGDTSRSPTKEEEKDRTSSPTNSNLSSETNGMDSTSSNPAPKRTFYPETNQILNLSRVRRRYFGVNLNHALNGIGTALSERLDSKAKQNSALLQSLHSFVSVPAVRSLVAGNLEKWLQSPGLSGLARTLFTTTVKNIKNLEPPHAADLEAIQKILAMRLKANQLTAHIENVTSIATIIPTGTVARQIYHQLLSEVLATIGRGADASASDQLKMAAAVYVTLPKEVSSDGIAASLLMLIGGSIESVSAKQAQIERTQLVRRLKQVLQLFAQKLGASFDVCKLLESLLAFNIEDVAWTTQDEDDRARLVFQCIMLLVPAPPNEGSRKLQKGKKEADFPGLDSDSLRAKLTIARKLVLSWFCYDYAPQFSTSKNKVHRADTGAGVPDYCSVLGGASDLSGCPEWLKTARCLLFMETGDSAEMQRFAYGSSGLDENNPTWHDEKYRIDLCCQFGCDFDDEMMGTVLKSAALEDGGISSEMALTLLEHLFECCSVHRSGSIKITDIMLAWEMYSLVIYEPPETVLVANDAAQEDFDPPGSRFDDADEEGGQSAMQGILMETEDLDLPQLAYPAMWWRVTILVLVMCGVDPKAIGKTVWDEHPTLRAMMKMVISSRYRFPTVDCDEADRARAKKHEQEMRDEESKIAEILFLPPKPKPKAVFYDHDNGQSKSRISARQQQKRERALKEKREKVVAEALLADNKRKKKLRAAQKTIILWDPTSEARKPPREVAELLVAVEASFNLSKIFQRTVEPDFLLMTIGKATRGAIERAYDWLIPIISEVPGTIARLHASASCVLLLRAYGTAGDERAQLQELSAPLLQHVSNSLKGDFGQVDAERAFDLLMSDVASRNPDRRRCARRVLYDSIGKLQWSDSFGQTTKPTISSWMLNILKLKHSKSLLSGAIKYLSTAVGFERGSVLRNILMALNELISYAKSNGIQGDWNFKSVFIGLLSSRQSVCAEALDRFVDLRALGIRIVYEEFQKKPEGISPTQAVSIKLIREIGEEKVVLSSCLLQAAAVLLSIWKEDDGIAHKETRCSGSEMADSGSTGIYIKSLADMLLQSTDGKASDGGLASAKMVNLENDAVSVESWVMLAKARSDTIARRAALTAPTMFLPRLLLCSGLPRASLLTMIDRLGKLAETSETRDDVYNQLLMSSATSQWDIGRLGHRREVARKLLGRLTAYMRLNNLSVGEGDASISTSFLKWLAHECSMTKKDRPRKLKTGKPKVKSASLDMSELAKAASFLETLGDANAFAGLYFNESSTSIEDAADIDNFRTSMEPMIVNSDESKLQDAVEKAISDTQPQVLEKLIQKVVETDENMALAETNNRKNCASFAYVILRKFLDAPHQQDNITRLVFTYVPLLSRLSGSPELWQLIFANKGEANVILDTLTCRSIECWCSHHLASCYAWLLSIGKCVDASAFHVPRMSRFLVLTSGQQSIHIDGFSAKVNVQLIDSWGKSEEFAISSANLAFEAMKQDNFSSGKSSGLMSRNDLPDWLVILLLLAKCGRAQMKFVCESVMERIAQPSDGSSLPRLRAVFLRLYVSNPQGMNLGSAKIRTLLMEAAEEYSSSWQDWRSPLDDQLNDMLETVMQGSGQRLSRPLIDLSKNHPLIVLRKCHALVRFLEQDATMGLSGTKDARGVVRGQSLEGPLDAVLSGKATKLRVSHWGYTYTEYIWIALLDILCAVPAPVLFGCGLEMGFCRFLNVNVRLVFVQSQLRRSERDFRLKEKLKEVFSAFRKTSPSGWDKWMTSTDHGLPSLGEMRNVMISLDFLDSKDVLSATPKVR